MIEDIEGLILIIAVILLVLNVAMFLMMGMQLANGMTPVPDTYKECIASDLPEHICEILYPPLIRESV